ncbi:hypothetical protein PROFUN_12831 [Planoprotostelium fungivorum]|uniref:Uncharacterized protein n=1 Tax=Planoprotostelium fungivorum TaxID=1890364 RepID=A0A2P6N6K1_9EUKA|nr:hypothetical protein PROFUN_12831 [Planoprotostelium fungivorum]
MAAQQQHLPSTSTSITSREWIEGTLLVRDALHRFLRQPEKRFDCEFHGLNTLNLDPCLIADSAGGRYFSIHVTHNPTRYTKSSHRVACRVG